MISKIVAVICAACSATALADTGLEFLEPQRVAYVRVQGTVRDDLSGSPVANARILAIWTGVTHGWERSLHHCLRIDATHSLPDGSFSLVTPADNVYRRGLSQQYVEIRVYATGLDERFEPGAEYRQMKVIKDSRPALFRIIGPAERGLDLKVRLGASQDDVPDRLQTLEELAGIPLGCETTGDASAIQAYFSDIATEAHSLARTAYQTAVADALESDARMLFADEENRSEARSKIMQQVYARPELDDLERRDFGGMTPLMKAASSGDAKAARALLRAGASPNRTRAGSDDSALTIAMSGYASARSRAKLATQYLETIKTLLADSRTNPDIRYRPVQYTPLMRALQLGQDDVETSLLAAGADPNLTAYGGRYSPLGIAVEALSPYQWGGSRSDAVHRFELLIASKRLNLDFVSPYDGDTALTRSLKWGYVEAATRLLEAGANPNAVNSGGKTALITATQASILNPESSAWINGVRVISAWPNVDHRVLWRGKTALQMARDAKRNDLIEILKER